LRRHAFPSQWTHLGGSRVSPYARDFGGRWLQISTTVRSPVEGGQVFDTITPATMKNATKLSESHPTWKWMKEDPSNGN
jgi:hypothetical protein